MRSAGNFSPEWGYLAPSLSFARTARVVLVATSIGATAGAGVVLSLIDHPSEPEKTPIAARAIVTSVRAEAVPSVAPTPASTAPTTSAAPATVTAPAKPALRSRASVAAAPPSAKPAAVNVAAPAPAASTAAVFPNTAAPAAPQPTPALPTAAVNAGAAVPASAPESASASAPAEPSNVVDAAPAGEPDGTTIMTPEQAPPAKKTKHHASNKNQFPGIGSIFRRVFASHGSRSYYPNSQ
jgi:hypothetical protein